MTKGISIETMYNDELPPRLRGTDTYLVKKNRGKLTLEDIEESFREKGFEGYVSIVLHISQDCYDGWSDGEEKRDMVFASLIDDGLTCPVCKQLSPLISYCPECGKRINTLDVSE